MNESLTKLYCWLEGRERQWGGDKTYTQPRERRSVGLLDGGEDGFDVECHGYFGVSVVCRWNLAEMLISLRSVTVDRCDQFIYA